MQNNTNDRDFIRKQHKSNTKDAAYLVLIR